MPDVVVDATLEAAVAGLILAITALARFYLQRARREEQKHALPRAARVQARMLPILQGVAGSLGAQRAVLMKAHNGGGVASPGSALKLTMVENWHPDALPSISGEYEARPLTDRDYRLMIGELDQRELMMLHTKALSPRSVLRDELERDFLASAWVVVVKRDARPSGFYFLLIGSKHIMPDTASTRSEVRTAAHKLFVMLATDVMRTVD